MKLAEIFDQLSYGELAQISIGGGNTGGINESNWVRVLASINLGLAELHSRFLIKEGAVAIELQPGLSTYVIDKKFAVSNYDSDSSVKYILDTDAAPYDNDLLRIERVYDANGCELELNMMEDVRAVDYTGCVTTSMNTLIIPATVVGPVTVMYRATHPLLVKELGYYDVKEVEVALPITYLNALLMFVASRIMNPIGMSQEFHDGNNYSMKYELACAQLLERNYRVDQSEKNHRAVRNGWV